MCKHSEEGDTDCLGSFDTAVKLFRPSRARRQAPSGNSQGEKVPHMGWNFLNTQDRLTHNENLKSGVVDQGSLLMQGLPKQADVYYVHSYYAEICEHTIGVCDYILPFSSM
jgi:glutamine amidotransferase